jgi:hypothetical protein
MMMIVMMLMMDELYVGIGGCVVRSVSLVQVLGGWEYGRWSTTMGLESPTVRVLQRGDKHERDAGAGR